ncbi:MAG: hypothetical protein ACRENE_34785, partial [Polyangiaceae bacterium]
MQAVTGAQPVLCALGSQSCTSPPLHCALHCAVGWVYCWERQQTCGVQSAADVHRSIVAFGSLHTAPSSHENAFDPLFRLVDDMQQI